MKRFITLLLILTSLVGFSQEYIERLVPAIGDRAGFVMYQPKTLEAGKKYPVLFLLHGIGERGSGSIADLQILAKHNNYTSCENYAKQYGFIIVEPQTPKSNGNWQFGEVEEAYQWLKDSLYDHIWWTKVYLSGQSLGGGGVNRYLGINPKAHLLFAAASPSAAGPNQYFLTLPKYLDTLINTQVPYWATHNRGDATVTPAQSTLAIRSAWIEKKGKANMWFTVFDIDGHTFPVFNRGKGATVSDYIKIQPLVGTGYVTNPKVNLYEWFLMNEIGKPAVAPATVTVVTPVPAPGTPKPPVDTVKPAPEPEPTPPPTPKIKRINATGKVKYTLQYEDGKGSGVEEAVEVDIVKLLNGRVRVTVRGAGKTILKVVEW